MRKISCLLTLVFLASNAFAQQPNRPENVTGIPVNYDEEKIGNYILPDSLTTADGKRVTDAKRIAVQGASRLGKTVLWTGISDRRFKMVIAGISGEGGAAIARRNYGETVAHITDPTRYFYQFAPNYHSYSNRLNELPFDAHFLVALMAPRPLLLQTGSTPIIGQTRKANLHRRLRRPKFINFSAKRELKRRKCRNRTIPLCF